jgi:hypothetical protein
VILDDLVLDVSRFMGEHPGGLFSLEHNVGRDISKFFYGGYSLENQSKVPAHSHSNDARKIVNTLIVGRLAQEAQSSNMKIASVDRSANKRGSVKTIKFAIAPAAAATEGLNATEDDGYVQANQSAGDEQLVKLQDQSSAPKQNGTCPILDVSSIGQHFLLNTTSHPATRGGSTPAGTLDRNKGGLNRQYTQAFCMTSTVYENLLRLAEDPTDTGAAAEISKEIQESSHEFCYLTIKNYAEARGLSHFVHQDIGSQSQIFEIKGRMGLSLGVQSQGTHIAFAAGTGILPFIDLVAHLLLVLISGNGTAVNSDSGADLLQGSANRVNPDTFKLVLYTSFLDEEEAVGLELIAALQELC